VQGFSPLTRIAGGLDTLAQKTNDRLLSLAI
jgi:hypothetical protein